MSKLVGRSIENAKVKDSRTEAWLIHSEIHTKEPAAFGV